MQGLVDAAVVVEAMVVPTLDFKGFKEFFHDEFFFRLWQTKFVVQEILETRMGVRKSVNAKSRETSSTCVGFPMVQEYLDMSGIYDGK
ncbi:hypothetical protein DES53_103225 [Roseimicrobium gellanilyticum]|uniref:Uncharacterized protein n=1 Tax=Roseimicrobium gellanilyticum TaxID=748857 RepID=A0A366HP10_9BACT|nr:hypothetical protein DES53_103225 [Roseimicrobium gellanilyticum]